MENATKRLPPRRPGPLLEYDAEKDTVYVTYALPTEEYEKLVRVADCEGTTPSAYTRRQVLLGLGEKYLRYTRMLNRGAH